MRLTAKGRYGVRVVLNLAASYGEGPKAARAIAAEESMSADFVEQLFVKLRRSGIVSSVRGPAGGFVLSRKPDELTIKDVLDAVGEPILAASRTDPDDSGQGLSSVTGRAWDGLAHTLNDFLSHRTVADVLSESGGNAEAESAEAESAEAENAGGADPSKQDDSLICRFGTTGGP